MKWLVVRRIWKNDQERYYEPGEFIELTDEAAAPLVEKQVITTPKVIRREKKKQELDNDTNYRSNL